MPLQKSPRRHITTKKYCLREKKFNGEQHHFSNGSVCVRTAMPKRWLNGSICHREQAQQFRIKHQHRQKKMLSVGAKKKRVKTSRSCSFYVSHFFHPLVRVSFFFIFHTFIFNNHLLNCCLSYTYTTQWISWFDFLLFFGLKNRKEAKSIISSFFFLIYGIWSGDREATKLLDDERQIDCARSLAHPEAVNQLWQFLVGFILVILDVIKRASKWPIASILHDSHSFFLSFFSLSFRVFLPCRYSESINGSVDVHGRTLKQGIDIARSNVPTFDQVMRQKVSFRHTNTHINANNCEWTNEDGTQYMEMVTSNHINELKWDGITANRKASYSVMVHIHILPPPMWPYFIVAIQCKCYPHIQRTTIINVHCANGVDHATRCWLHSSVSMVSMIQHIVSHSCRSLAAAHFYTSHYYYCYFYFFHFYFLHR